jgi:Mg-chelatase subunit ChlD
VEFFGRKRVVQRVCYVVDCSGSMYGSMYLVKDQLKQSILNLNSQQAFSVIFFTQGQQIMTLGDGRLQPATVKAKSKAVKLIQSVRPAGSTDAEHALQWAMKLKSANGHRPEVIYFLTDGFDLDADRSKAFVRRVDRMRRFSAPGTVLHTIGFWPQPQDRQLLRSLAQNAGGEFIEIN